MARVVFVFGLSLVWLSSGLQGSARADVYDHEVLPGDTLGGLAQQYGTTVERIRRKNRLKSSRLRPGQHLKIVSKARVSPRARSHYRVRKGDTPAGIARRHRLKLAQLLRLNPAIRRRPLRIGESLWVLTREQVVDRRPNRKLVQFASAPGYVVRDLERAWATPTTVRGLSEVLTAYAVAYPDAAPIEVWDISRERGGYLPPHRSHRSGRDVDLRYPTREGSGAHGPVGVKQLDLERTWFVVKRFVQTQSVVYVFMDRTIQAALYRFALAQGEDAEFVRSLFQYPSRSGRGLIRHTRGHRTHLHVRFKREPTPEPDVS